MYNKLTQEEQLIRKRRINVMNDSLKSAFDEYNNLKSRKRRNYKACYDSFLEYCDIFSNYSLKVLFKNMITLH